MRKPSHWTAHFITYIRDPSSKDEKFENHAWFEVDDDKIQKYDNFSKIIKYWKKHSSFSNINVGRNGVVFFYNPLEL